MIKQNKTHSQKALMFSKQISSLPNSSLSVNQLPIFEEDALYPRVFPDNKIPLKVAIMRKMKMFEEYDLNEALIEIDWKYEKGMLELLYYNFQTNNAVQECTKQKLSKKLVKGRAYHHQSNTFKEFNVVEIDQFNGDYILVGYFIQSPNKMVRINKFYVCLSFQNPELYSKMIIQAQQTRQIFLNTARFNFYIDNMDLQHSPELPKLALNRITKFIGVQFLNRQYYQQLNNHFKRIMNQLLFTHTILSDPSIRPDRIHLREKRKVNEFKPKSKVITLLKDGKKFKLTLKSLKTKIEEIESKTIFFKDEVVDLMHKIKQKLQIIYQYKIFDLKEQLQVIDRFTGDNLLMVGYFIYFLNENVIGSIGDLIRKSLQNNSNGWFKLYDLDRNTYLLSKLRRMFIFVEQNVKTVIKNHIQMEMVRYIQVFRRRLPSQINFQSFKNLKLVYTQESNTATPGPLLIISCSIGVNNFEIMIKREKLHDLLRKNLKNVLNKLENINSPQNRALLQIYSIFKDQYGIQIELPIEYNPKSQGKILENIKVNEYKYAWISQEHKELNQLLKKSVENLKIIQQKLVQISVQINLKEIISDQYQSNIPLQNNINKIKHFKALNQRIQEYFPETGVNFGLFFIDYKPAKDQLQQFITKKIQAYKQLLIKQYQRSSASIEQSLQRLIEQIKKKPSNIYQLVKQRQKLQRLQQTIKSYNESYQIQLFNLCQDYHCKLPKADLDRFWLNKQKIKKIFTIRQSKDQEYKDIKKGITNDLSKQKDQIAQILKLFQVTLQYIKTISNRQLFQENYQKLEHLNKKYLSVKNQIQDIRFKQQHLFIGQSNFELFLSIEADFLILFTLWEGIYKWEINRQIWYYKQFRQFQINKPEILITETLHNFKKIQKSLKSNYSPELYTLMVEVKKQIEFLQDNHLRLLKLLKKQGFSKKHLQKIGLYIDCQIESFSLQKAIDAGFLQMIQQIQGVSNDAWNEFYLQQTLNRVQTQLFLLKYQIITYLDKKGNQIPLVNNYNSLYQNLQQIILDLQSVQFNPMKGNFQIKINDLLQRSIYMSKSLQNCELFQKKFVEVHPIFDSTDVVKQLPLENRMFMKLLRTWVELIKYFKKIISVYDSCNGQNIAQKMLYMIGNIQKIKVGLANYLQKKRQGFSRFYLLTDPQLYQLFASTNDMNILSKHISKLFHSINSLVFDNQCISSINGFYTDLSLKTKIYYKNQNLEEWLTALERSIKEELNIHIDRLLKNQNKWQKMLNYQCSQILLMAYDIEKTGQIMNLTDLKKIQEKQRFFIRRLVDIKKNSSLTMAESVNLGSLLVLSLYFSEKINFLICNNINDIQNFQIKKMMKIYYKQEQIKITSFETEIGYGFQYLGLVKRLVLTNLTERMQLIYMSAMRYSLGGSAIGPAGTGKSQTTKDIARICGKNCIIYNCSQSLSIDLIVRILKGMVVTGLWICLDQFNRLHFQVLNMISEQLSIIFKYKAMGLKINVEYDRQIINFKPDFHLCITYNPTYISRVNIPNSVQRQFRIVAMVNCDKKMICKLLFYSKGFKQADSLSQKINTIFEYCQDLWRSFKLYDFGLRTLISIIQLSGILYKGEGKGQTQVNEAIRILVFPRLEATHREVLASFVKKIFDDGFNLPIENTPDAYMRQIHNILNVRLGVILLGDIFSNKGTVMKKFAQTYSQYHIEEIFINALTIEQIYGETNQTTRIFKDGYLTKKIREYINSNSKQKLIIYIKGVIFSDWIENLNSVLDNTRSLSLPSGQILSIPQTIKFIINCQHLLYASPATISRSCIVSYKVKTSKQLIKCSQDKEYLRQRIFDRFQLIFGAVKSHLLYQIDQRLIIHWINKYIQKSKIQFSLEIFLHVFSIIMEGMVTDEGKKIFNTAIMSYLSIQGDISNNYWDGKNWKQLKDISLSSLTKNTVEPVQIGDIIIKNKKYRKLFYLNKTFFMNKGGLEDILLLIGRENIGKSSIISSIYSQADKKQIQFNKINLTRKIKNVNLYQTLQSMLVKKSNKRKGMIGGKQLVVLLDDIHLPQQNKYKYKDTAQLLNLMISKKGCYNYNSLEFQHLQDIYLIGNNNQITKQMNFNKDFLKKVMPVFIKSYQEEEIKEIFAELITRTVQNKQQTKYYLQNSFKLTSMIKEIEEISMKYLPKYFRFQFIHFRKIITNILLWNTQEIREQKQIATCQLFVYQTQRIILSRLNSLVAIDKMKEIIRKTLSKDNQNAFIFHSFEKTENGTAIENKKCNRVISLQEFMREIQLICDEYILFSDNEKSNFVIFPEICTFICRISRGFSLRQGHISIVGLPKCGKKVIVELCNYLIRGKIYKINDKYQQKLWYETIKNATKQSFQNKSPSILLVEHHQLKHHSQKQQLSILLKTSYLPQVYSEADYEQLIYLFQNQLIKSHLPVNKQSAMKLFISYLQNNFHVALLFNPMVNDFKENIIFYPAILKNTEFSWILDWPKEALYMIATQAIIDHQVEPHLKIFPQIHSICKSETLSKSKIPHWEGLYLDFLRIFDKIFSQRSWQLQNEQDTLTKSFNIIKQTELKLQATRDQIKKLQPAILMLQKQTIKTIKSLNIQKSNAESVNEQLAKKQIQCSKIMAQSNAVKMKLQVTNAKVEQQLKKAWQNVYLVKQSHISQIKSLMNPSELIKIVVTAIVIILNEGEFEIIRNRSEDGLSYEQNYFETGKRHILSKDSKLITKTLTEYNKQKLTKQKVALVEQKCLNHPRWNIIQAKNANKAIYYFFLWVQSVVKYFKLFQQTIPLREELAKTTAIYEEKSKEIEIVKKQLEIYDRKIRELVEVHKEKTFKLSEYTNQIKLYEKMLSRGYEIFKEIQSQKSKWQQYQLSIQQRFKQNLGNSILSSILITYLSPHTIQMRTNLLQQIKPILSANQIIINKNDIYWLMPNEQEIVFRQLGIYDDEYVLNNLKIIEKTQKISFIIDPQEEGIKYLTDRYKTQGVMFIQKIDYQHKLIKKTLQRSIIQGSVIFVEISGLDIPYLLESLINPCFRKNNSSGFLQLLFEQKYIICSPKFKIYLFTSNAKQEYSISLISKVTTINFSITQKQLEQNIINVILSIQYPQENEQLEQINKVNIKDNIELKNIQSKVLNIFANMTDCEQILRTEDLLQILSTSNRLFNQIQHRIEDSNQKRTVLKNRRNNFVKKAEKTSKLYFAIKKLQSISSYYQYSFNWFINLFKDNLNTFTEILCIELSKALQANKKIIAPLVIAQSQFPKIAFNKLFSERVDNNQITQSRYKLQVSRLRLAKIIANVQQSQIQHLDQLLRNSPQRIAPILTSNVDQIMNFIPDQFSNLQFFDKITLINCFRPDCTLKLLKDWLDRNLGVSYKFQPARLLQNAASNKPILVFEQSSSLQSPTNSIYKLFDSFYLNSGKSICYINSNHCNLRKISMLLESGFQNDQWIILQGLGQSHQELNEILLNLFKEGDFKNKSIFRLWIIINEYELNHVRDKLIKLSNKITFQHQTDIVKKIKTTFMQQSQRLQNSSKVQQINKKKYILNQICIFHYLLNQKCKYRQKQFNKSINFSLDDLQVNIKYLYFTSPSQLKKIYPNIVTNIIYGGKMTDQQDIKTVSLHIDQCTKNMIVDKNAFWQTVWADDKFPNNQQEYQMYLKNHLAKALAHFKSIHQQYGINTFVINFTKQKQYKEIMDFYNKSKTHQNRSFIHEKVKVKLQTINQLIIQKLSTVNINLKANRSNPFYYYLVDQQRRYKTKMETIQHQIKYYLQREDLIGEDQKIWGENVVRDIIPKSWEVSTIRSLQSWIHIFLGGLQFFFTINHEDQKEEGQETDKPARIYSLQYCFYFPTFCQQIYQTNKCDINTHCLLWQTQKTELLSKSLGVKVDRWYLWNAVFEQQEIKPLREGTIQIYYYSPIPRGIISVITKQSLKALKQYSQILVYHNSFEYGDNPEPLARIYMPVQRNADREWTKRMRVHLTLTL